MRIRKLALLAAALSVPLAGPVLAADAIIEQPPEPPVADVAPQAYLWSGGYVGGYGEYKWGEFSTAPTQNANGFGGGVYGGYNWQSDNIVYGAEADLGYSGADFSAAGLTGKQGFNGSLRARMGVDINPFLIYATGGIAATNAKLTNASGSDSNTHVGWTVGTGAEAFLTENITTRIEYRYTDYQSKNYNLGGTNVSSGFDDHSVRVGIGMKF
ncbi:outer membrane protein [Hoeflea sp. AS16]|uniref:outer membrane protein n=1 Tax=unclassified Hoeflea TaxID=2614931 RepID=UPI00317BD2CA